MLRIKIKIHKIKLFYFEMEQRKTKTKIRPFKSPFFLLFNINKTFILLVFKEYVDYINYFFILS